MAHWGDAAPKERKQKVYIQYCHAKMKYIRGYRTVPYLQHKHVSLVRVTSLFYLHHVFSVSLTVALTVPETGVGFIRLPKTIEIPWPKCLCSEIWKN
jgi:hypothetical protein